MQTKSDTCELCPRLSAGMVTPAYSSMQSSDGSTVKLCQACAETLELVACQRNERLSLILESVMGAAVDVTRDAFSQAMSDMSDESTDDDNDVMIDTLYQKHFSAQ